MNLRHDFQLLRDRLRSASKGRGLWLFGGAILILVLAVVGLTFVLLRPKPAPVTAAVAPVYCRPCAALSRLERAMTQAMARDEDFSAPPAQEDRGHIIAAITGWQQRCATLLCSQPPGRAMSCAAPSASLLTELASIDSLSESLSQRTASCTQGGCQAARCDAANTAQMAFSGLHQQLVSLIDNPAALVGDRRQASTGFVFDQLGALDDTVLAAPGFVADGRFASAQSRLLYLRDQAAEADAAAPGGAEGLLADRLEEVNTAIEALVQGRRVGVTGSGLVSLWRDFAEVSARLLVEAATMRAESQRGVGAIQAMLHPELMTATANQTKVCQGTLRLVQSTEQHLAQSMGRLDLCNHGSDCLGEETGTAASSPSAESDPLRGRTVLEALAGEREAAAAALRPLTFQKDDDVTLTTDLKQYFTGEAIAVQALPGANRCLNDRGSHLALERAGPTGAGDDIVETHTLDPADAALWLFEAPREPGSYRFVLEAAKSRGAGLFGASVPFVVTPPEVANCAGFSGRWQTDFGLLTLYIRDGIARGSYRQNDSDRAGVLIGTVDGPALTGRWTSELGDGGAKLTLDPNGRSFTGTWSQYPDRVSGAGKWDGQCVGPSSLAPGASTPSPMAFPPRQG